MARTTINSLGIPADTIVSADLDYPLTDFSSTGIDDNATSTALTIDSSDNISATGRVNVGRDRNDSFAISLDTKGPITWNGSLDTMVGRGVTGSTTYTDRFSIKHSISGATDDIQIELVPSNGSGGRGSVGVIGGLKVTDEITIADTTNSTSTSTGALIVGGGVGIASDLYVGGSITVSGTVDGRDLATDGTKLDGIAASATNYGDSDVATYISGNRSYGNITTTGYIAGPSTFTIDPAAVGDNTGTLVIAGNLQVDGTTTTINSTTMTVDDLNITLASGAANAAAANGAGITVDGASATLTYNGTNDDWNFNKTLNVTGNLKVDSNAANVTLTLENSTNANGYIQYSADGTMRFYTGPAGGSTNIRTTINSSGQFTIVDNTDISMSSGAAGQFNIDGNGYNGAIALDATAMHIYHNSATRALILGTDETERLRITGSGIVGIGTNSPAYRLSVAEINTTASNRTTPVDVLEIQAQYQGGDGQPFGTAGDASFGSGLVFTNEKYTNSNITRSAAIYGLVSENSTATTGGGQLAFYTASTLDATLTEKMRILPNGNVGINEINPQEKLSVVGGILAASSSGSTSGITIESTATSGYVSTITHTDTGVEFDTGSILRNFEFDGAGTNLWTLFTNTGNITQNYGVYRFAATTSGSDTGSQFQLWGTNGGPGYMAAYQLNFNTGNNNARTTALKIDNSGNLDITGGGAILFPWNNTGTYYVGQKQNTTNLYSTTQSLFEIRGADAIAGAQAMAGGDIRMRAGLGVVNPGLGVYAGDAIIQGGESTSGSNSGAGQILFYTGGTATERARITSDGHLLVGGSGLSRSTSSNVGSITAGATFGTTIAGTGGGGGTVGSNLTLNSSNAPRIAYSHTSGYGASGVFFSWGSTYFYNTAGNVTAGGAPDLSMSITTGAGNSTIPNDIKHYDRSGNVIKRDHFYRFVTTTGAASAHMKTNISWASHTQMYSIHFEGQEYQASRAIDTTLSWYSYNPSNAAINIGSYGTHSATVYQSSDGYVVMRLDYNSSSYYSAFTLSMRTTAQNINASFQVTAATVGTTANQY